MKRKGKEREREHDHAVTLPTNQAANSTGEQQTKRKRNRPSILDQSFFFLILLRLHHRGEKKGRGIYYSLRGVLLMEMGTECRIHPAQSIDARGVPSEARANRQTE
mmetsp:Transcript_36361/g.71563  ORF Transcript_36361/g.71563 Transcript_36361/m.71563 type:complete len:106 (+) Transcript_36361:1553-1870(+)